MLSTLLGSETRARVLMALLARPHREYHLRELIRLTGGGASGVQREVERLERTRARHVGAHGRRPSRAPRR